MSKTQKRLKTNPSASGRHKEKEYDNRHTLLSILQHLQLIF